MKRLGSVQKPERLTPTVAVKEVPIVREIELSKAETNIQIMPSNQVRIDSEVVYVVSVKNTGSVDIINADWVIEIPPFQQLQNIDTSGAVGWDVSAMSVGNGITIQSVAPVFSVGEQAVLRFVLRQELPTIPEKTFNVCTNFGAENVSPFGECAQITVLPSDARANLVLRKRSALKHRTITYYLSVLNDGPSSATNLTITDILPPEVELLSVTDHERVANIQYACGVIIATWIGETIPGQERHLAIVVEVSRQHCSSYHKITNRALATSLTAQRPNRQQCARTKTKVRS